MAVWPRGCLLAAIYSTVYYAPLRGPKGRDVALIGATRGVHLYFAPLLVTTGYYRLLQVITGYYWLL